MTLARFYSFQLILVVEGAFEDIVHKTKVFVNMQNIPSHALDIRHLFRATPEQTEVIKLTESNSVSVTLGKYDSIPTSNGPKKVKDIQQDDIVILQEDNVDAPFRVESIQLKTGQATITLRKEDI